MGKVISRMGKHILLLVVATRLNLTGDSTIKATYRDGQPSKYAKHNRRSKSGKPLKSWQ